jgi:LPS export ABC transporter protein LptC
LRAKRNRKETGLSQNPPGGNLWVDEQSEKKRAKGKNCLFLALSFSAFTVLLSAACSFDYGSSLSGEEETPDIIMNDVEYVRVRDGDPQVRFKAELVERYEESRIMELSNFSFEQFERRGGTINATGSAGTAHVELDSGDINLAAGVTLAVESEDIVIETAKLDWKDEQRDLSGDKSDLVKIDRANGTSFSGRGFSANARSRTWGFSGGISGTYIHDDEDEESGEGAESDDTPDTDTLNTEAGRE